MTLLGSLLKKKSSLQNARKVSEERASEVRQSVTETDQAIASLMATANGQLQAGDSDAACELYKQILELDSTNARAYYMLSGIALKDGDIPSAVELVRRAIALEPDQPTFHFSLAGVYLARGQMHEALHSYQHALRLRPDSLVYKKAVAGALIAVGRLDDGVDAYREIVRVSGEDAEAYLDLGKALQLRDDLKGAEEALARAARLSPNHADAHLHLALVRRQQGRPVDAEEPARRAVALSPDIQQGWFVLGSVLGDQGRHPEAVQHFRRVIAMDPTDDAAWSGVLFSMNYSERFTPREVFDEHVKYGEQFPRAPRIVAAGRAQKDSGRLRVGYLSPDFQFHPVAYFIAPILASHDRGRFEIFCYHTGKQQDGMTARLKHSTEHWRQMSSVSDQDLMRTLCADELDIIVELSGHSDRQRLRVLAKRIAPIQITYLGYPNTTGVRSIDYRITDARADPPGDSDGLHVERLVRLPETFLCYAPPSVEVEQTTAAFLRNGHITFGSFNNFAKLSPFTIRLWCSLLASVPGSQLVIKTRGLQDAGLRSLLLRQFQERGIDSARIRLAAPIAEQQQHFEAYNQVDIALDSFPYNGTTTTMEALWMGVPVVTLRGDRHASRVGSSILACLGLDDLVATNEREYVDIATRLTASGSSLEALHRTLRSRLMMSPLTDGVRFTANLEQAYVQLQEEVLSGARERFN